MGIGVGVFLIAVGLILAVATRFDVAGLDVQTVGWILVFVGVLVIILTTVFWGRRGGDHPQYAEDRAPDEQPPP